MLCVKVKGNLQPGLYIAYQDPFQSWNSRRGDGGPNALVRGVPGAALATDRPARNESVCERGDGL